MLAENILQTVARLITTTPVKLRGRMLSRLRFQNNSSKI